VNDNIEAAKLQSVCDRCVEVAAETMFDAGASLGMIVDRLLTYAIAQMVVADGSKVTAHNLRYMSANIEAGAFDKVAEKSRGGRSKH
jgi:hypothetical protein